MPLHLILSILTILALLPGASSSQAASSTWSGNLQLAFDDSVYTFSASEQAHIEEIARQSAYAVNALIPGLPDELTISVATIDRDLSSVGGITGWAEDPNTVVIFVSTSFKGGIASAIDTGLAPVLYHEFHHLVRGWTIKQNKFGPGILNAAINEGLANVFSEDHTGKAFAGNAFPENAGEWFEEITKLPINANYSHWMSEHPDGRQAIGYKAGSFIIREAMANSGLSVIELSAKPVAEILALANSD